MHGVGFDGRDIRATFRRLGASAFNGIALLVIAAPLIVAWSWRAGVDDTAFNDNARTSRTIVGAEVLETRASEGLAEVADDVAKAAKPPDWELLRSLLEARRQADLWYSVRVEWTLDDGDREETTYVRHPYHDREDYREFLRIVRSDGRETSRPETMLKLPWTEDQTPIPDVILHQLRETRPWAR